MSTFHRSETKEGEGQENDQLEDLIFAVLKELRIMNIQLAIMTDNEITKEDLENA